MKDYEVTVSRTGGIKIKANSSREASKKVRDMPKEQIEKLVSFCDYEVTDVCELPEPVYYYSVVMEDTKIKRFFRADKEISDTPAIMEYAIVAKGIGESQDDLFWAELLDEHEYREQIISYLKTQLDEEREAYHNELKALPVEEIISYVGKIQFFDDMIQLLEDKENDDEFEIPALENLLSMNKPLDYLYERYYINIDFSSTNEQMISIFNSEG